LDFKRQHQSFKVGDTRAAIRSNVLRFDFESLSAFRDSFATETSFLAARPHLDLYLSVEYDAAGRVTRIDYRD